ncbi:MAG: tetratricopeptide repeat protein [Verrucomicrobia bacterium]|nr:tetratricopeptide repeat protein [Verrucomicrobiota bacterium]
MEVIGPPDIHHLNAAAGWLGLGAPADAAEELDRIHPGLQGHPDVLAVRWQLFATQKRWEEALQVARNLVDASPMSSCGWVDQSFALHELRRTAEAREKLMLVSERFHDVLVIPYNLACYCCQLGDESEARAWLHRAVQVGGRDEVRTMALADPDLEPLWGWIRKW